jgi:hypothetical protein
VGFALMEKKSWDKIEQWSESWKMWNEDSGGNQREGGEGKKRILRSEEGWSMIHTYEDTPNSPNTVCKSGRWGMGI